MTRLAIDDLDADGNGIAAYIATFDDAGAATDRGMLYIRDTSDDDLLIYRVTGLADNAGWTQLSVAHVAGTALPAAGARLAVWFTPAGAKPMPFVTTDQTWNVGNSPNATLTLTANRTLSISGDTNGGIYTLLVRQDGTGGRTLAFPSGWKWRGGIADTIASGANAETLITIRRIGSSIYVAPMIKGID